LESSSVGLHGEDHGFPLCFDRESYASQAPDSPPSLISLWRAFRAPQGPLDLRGSREYKR
ncbi:hypothetical protein DVA81_18550, partial [Acinetobacter baumannii]